MSTTISPPEDDLRRALLALKTENPTLGLQKLRGLLLAVHPDWVVSEKRARAVLQGAEPTSSTSYPTSKVMQGLDVAKWSPKIEVRYFDQTKGKGLIAKEPIAEGETIWKEDPFILAPEWNLYDMQMSGQACGHCSTPLTASPLVVPCAASSSSMPCPFRFCSRLCLSRSARAHPLLCASRNPASAPLLHFARKYEWMALHALAQCTARVLLAFQQDDKTFAEDWDIVRSLAQLGMEERAKRSGLPGAEPDRALWKNAHKLYLQAFREPSTDVEKKRLAKVLRRPLREDVSAMLFEYDGFLLGLGRMSLNLEAHGGLYVLHSHINHRCTPNVSVRHFDQRTALSRITVIAKQDIAPGEELFITYVDPQLSFQRRQRSLMEWGFGKCTCGRCAKEGEESGSGVDGNADEEKADLEAELKAGFGVM